MSFWDLFRLKATQQPKAPVIPDPAENPPSKAGLPIKRVSIDDEWPSALSNLGGNLWSFVLPRRWPLEIYDIISDLCLNVPDLRQAVGHIVQLGNTGHIIKMTGEDDQAIEKAVARIETRANYMFPWSGGTEGMINNMFGQIARTGALSMEWVPNKGLTGVDKAFMVPVAEIRWVPRADMMGYYPVQIPRNLMQWAEGTKPIMIVLNPRTYYYANAEMMENCPYAIPPFVAAMGPISTQRAMLRNIDKVVKKLGIMGLISYAVEPPAQHPGENEDKYHARCKTYLQEIHDQIKGNLGDGIAVGFKGAFEFNVQGVSGDAKGVSEIFINNEQQLFSALMADPAMHGRTYSTTETYASVVYSKMISLLANYQMMVANGLEFGWGLDFLLAGLGATVEVEFKASQALSNLQEAQAKMVEIANAEAMYQGGVIDQDQKANLLGYPVPAEEEPLPDPALAQDPNLDQRKTNTGGKTDNTSKKTKRKQAKTVKHTLTFNRHTKRYDLQTGLPYEVRLDHVEKDGPMDSHARRYL